MVRWYYKYCDMGSIVFRNRYWFYKSLYDDYIGRDFKLALGLCSVLWLPHYWYFSINAGPVWRSTGPSRRTHPISSTSRSGVPAETDSPTASYTRSSKWCWRIGSSWKTSTNWVRRCLCRRRSSVGQSTPMIYQQYRIKLSNPTCSINKIIRTLSNTSIKQLSISISSFLQ